MDESDVPKLNENVAYRAILRKRLDLNILIQRSGYQRGETTGALAWTFTYVDESDSASANQLLSTGHGSPPSEMMSTRRGSLRPALENDMRYGVEAQET